MFALCFLGRSMISHQPAMTQLDVATVIKCTVVLSHEGCPHQHSPQTRLAAPCDLQNQCICNKLASILSLLLVIG